MMLCSKQVDFLQGSLLQISGFPLGSESRPDWVFLELPPPLPCREENLLKPQDTYFNSFCVLIMYTKVQVFK